MQDSAGQKPAEQQVQSRPSWTEVRTRDAVENSHILRLAGMQEYPADEVAVGRWRSRLLMKLAIVHLTCLLEALMGMSIAVMN